MVSFWAELSAAGFRVLGEPDKSGEQGGDSKESRLNNKLESRNNSNMFPGQKDKRLPQSLSRASKGRQKVSPTTIAISATTTHRLWREVMYVCGGIECDGGIDN